MFKYYIINGDKYSVEHKDNFTEVIMHSADGTFAGSWVFKGEPQGWYFDCEFWKLVEKKKIVLVGSFKEGKQILLGL